MRPAVFILGRFKKTRDAEISQFGQAISVNQDIGRFNVAMNQPGPMRPIQCRQYLPGNGNRPGYRDFAQQAQKMPEADAIHEFRHDVRQTQSLDYTHAIDADYIRMVDSRSSHSFAHEVHRARPVLQDFEDNLPAQRDLLGQIDDGHGGFVEFADNMAPGHGLANKRVIWLLVIGKRHYTADLTPAIGSCFLSGRRPTLHRSLAAAPNTSQRRWKPLALALRRRYDRVYVAI